jgi:hypothetical protein
MMSTLFIGYPDVIFSWSDHRQLLVGTAIGIFVTTMLLSAFVYLKRRETVNFEPVAMNELKSKAID